MLRRVALSTRLHKHAPRSFSTPALSRNATADNVALTARSGNQYKAPSPSSPPQGQLAIQQPRRRHSPYDLAQRLVKLCSEDRFADAAHALRTAPRYAQNIKVWNTLIQQCMNAEKRKMAYTVFTDLKRRGFTPNLRTYNTMMLGYASVTKWDRMEKILDSATSVYQQLKKHVEDMRRLRTTAAGSASELVENDSEVDPALVLFPFALYISILGEAGRYQEAFDVFHDLDVDGPYRPNAKIYSTLLHIICNREPQEGADRRTVQSQNANDAKYVWRRMARAMEKDPFFTLEPRTIENVAKALLQGGPSDHQMLFDFFGEFYGLPRPGQERKPAKVAFTQYSFEAVLRSCISLEEYTLCLHYADLVMADRKLMTAFQPWHATIILNAQLHFANPRSTAEPAYRLLKWMVSRAMTPNANSVSLALQICRCCEDWDTAIRIVELVTSSSTTAARGALFPPVLSGQPGTIHLSELGWSNLFHTALAKSDLSIARQCLNLLKMHGRQRIAVWKTEEEQLDVDGPQAAMATTFIKLVDCAYPRQNASKGAVTGAEGDGVEDRAMWLELKGQAAHFLKIAKVAPRKQSTLAHNNYTRPSTEMSFAHSVDRMKERLQSQ
ncbi:hypothetical protein BV25DRAFT_1986294 [Artomyces pyxidatus]|uniref:Uncharacterized protein n=1 Tax=Artomyces pyxidatus TaxID=48021 RepID=A0ACB8TJW4_9AGAM|nr:hypothetical protein BV25DRAFT_1986294 [Artomyces pyxidatus]